MDAPRPGTETPSSEQSITYQWVLPCGCKITHSCRNTGTAVIDDANAEKFAVHAHRQLSFWYRDRQPRHQCALVSPENPNGISPRHKSEEEPA